MNRRSFIGSIVAVAALPELAAVAATEAAKSAQGVEVTTLLRSVNILRLVPAGVEDGVTCLKLNLIRNAKFRDLVNGDIFTIESSEDDVMNGKSFIARSDATFNPDPANPGVCNLNADQAKSGLWGVTCEDYKPEKVFTVKL